MNAVLPKIPPGGEEAAQAELMAWLYRTYPAVWARTHHSPAGGHRNKVTAARLRVMGCKRGFPDLVALHQVPPFFGFVCELKTGNGSLNAEQRQWLETFVDQCRFVAFCCDSLLGAQRIISAYVDDVGDYHLRRITKANARYYRLPKTKGVTAHAMATRPPSHTR